MSKPMELRQTAVNRRCPACGDERGANVYLIGQAQGGCHLHIRICWNGCRTITGKVHVRPVRKRGE